MEVECPSCRMAVLSTDECCAQCGLARAANSPTLLRTHVQEITVPLAQRTEPIKATPSPSPSQPLPMQAQGTGNLVDQAPLPRSALRKAGPKRPGRIAFASADEVIPITGWRNERLWWKPEELSGPPKKRQRAASRTSLWAESQPAEPTGDLSDDYGPDATRQLAAESGGSVCGDEAGCQARCGPTSSPTTLSIAANCVPLQIGGAQSSSGAAQTDTDSASAADGQTSPNPAPAPQGAAERPGPPSQPALPWHGGTFAPPPPPPKADSGPTPRRKRRAKSTNVNYKSTHAKIPTRKVSASKFVSRKLVKTPFTRPPSASSQPLVQTSASLFSNLLTVQARQLQFGHRQKRKRAWSVC